MNKAKPITDRLTITDTPPPKTRVSQSKAIYDSTFTSKAEPRPTTTGEQSKAKPSQALPLGRMDITREANPIPRSIQ